MPKLAPGKIVYVVTRIECPLKFSKIVYWRRSLRQAIIDFLTFDRFSLFRITHMYSKLALTAYTPKEYHVGNFKNESANTKTRRSEAA